MSLLREIMARLRQRAGGVAIAAASDGAPSRAQQAYGERMANAADAELLYEWEWIEQRLAAIATSGSEDRRQLLGWRRQLSRECERRALSPIKPPASVDLASHAWELTDEALRRAWHIA